MRGLLLVIGVALTVGCGKRPRDDDSSGSSTAPADTNTYTITLAKRNQDSKILVIETYLNKVTAEGTGVNETEEKSGECEYVEQVRKQGDPDPLKITRAYQYARESVGAKKRELRYSGKTVLIEKTGDLYAFSIGGIPLPADDSQSLVQEFSGAGPSNARDRLMPKTAVRIDEVWVVNPEVLREVSRTSTEPLDADRSKIRGRLVKAYRSADGAQWGLIEWRCELFMSSARKPNYPEKMVETVTMEMVIDGSSAEGKMTDKVSAEWTVSAKGKSIRVTLAKTHTKIKKPIK